VTDGFSRAAGPDRPAIEIVTVARDQAVILMGSCRPLARLPRLRPIEIAPGRFLLTIEPGTPTETLEVELSDLLDASETSAEDRAALGELLRILRTARRERSISKAEILFVQPLE
jgi:hypothetical protein